MSDSFKYKPWLSVCIFAPADSAAGVGRARWMSPGLLGILRNRKGIRGAVSEMTPMLSASGLSHFSVLSAYGSPYYTAINTFLSFAAPEVKASGRTVRPGCRKGAQKESKPKEKPRAFSCIILFGDTSITNKAYSESKAVCELTTSP